MGEILIEWGFLLSSFLPFLLPYFLTLAVTVPAIAKNETCRWMECANSFKKLAHDDRNMQQINFFLTAILMSFFETLFALSRRGRCSRTVENIGAVSLA